MAELSVRPATRKAAKPLVGLYSESGNGKTYNALLVARGYVGPKGRIAMIETESGRGEAYADPREYPEFAGDGQETNYDVISLHDDFSPKKYGAAIRLAEDGKYDALIIDSASHEWEGIGGVLSMAADNESKGLKGVLVWQQPKIQHKREFMLRFMQTSIPLVILCMRAKYPMEQKKKANGGTEWVKSETLDPIQSEDILFEMFLHGYFDKAHNFHLTKNTARGLAEVFPSDKPFTIETGNRFAAWAKGTGAGTVSSTTGQSHTATNTASVSVELKAEGEEAAEGGMEVLQAWFKRLPRETQSALKPFLDETLKPIAARADADEAI